MSTLLYNLIHVFLDNFLLPQLDNKSWSFEGYGLRGIAWQDIDFALAVAANDAQFLGLDVSLKRTNALCKEMRCSSKID